MTQEQLLQELKNLKAYKAQRVRLGTAAIEHNLLAALITLCKPSSGVSHQACWSLEQSFLLYESRCYPFLKQICALYKLEINSSAKRALCKIAHILTKKYYRKKEHEIQHLLTQEMREQIVEGCFQELIATDKTANMAYSVHALYELGKEFDWIYPALAPILSQKLDQDYGNGFKASARHIITKIERSF